MYPRVVLRHPALSDQPEFIGRVRASRALHKPWVAAPSTPEQFSAYVNHMHEPANCGFIIRSAEEGSMVGVVNRLEANIQPGNTASIALVKSCGFMKEGYSPKYLKINGRWRDHERWAILVS
jgi:[ribosomal protein S5]-alanine N-acetyltransferase